jgi:hypothetical protein
MSTIYLDLHRIYKQLDCTIGYMRCGGQLMFTLERPWVPTSKAKGGTRFISCVPPNTSYLLVGHNGTKYKNTVCLVNPTVDVYQYPSDSRPHSRYACLVHPANYPSEVNGCIALGLECRQTAVYNSRKACRIFNDIISSQKAMGRNVILRIHDGENK